MRLRLGDIVTLSDHEYQVVRFQPPAYDTHHVELVDPTTNKASVYTSCGTVEVVDLTTHEFVVGNIYKPGDRLEVIVRTLDIREAHRWFDLELSL